MSSPRPSIIRENVSLASRTWFETGGPARFFAEPKNAQELKELTNWAQNTSTPICVLGRGANVLVSDQGFNGLIIHPKITTLSIDQSTEGATHVTAGSGVDIDDFIAHCLAHNIIGFEEFSAIPGTIGGAVFINIHYFAASLSDFLINATILDTKTGVISTVDKNWLSFGYDYSRLHDSNFIVIDATFKLKQGSELEGAFARGRSAEITRHRKQRYPYKGTCGSFFKNFSEDKITLVSNGRKAIWVAYYLDKLGIKGELCFGDACVSHQHANMIVNKGHATSQDIVTLARTMQQKVYDAFGLIPEPECQFIGFDTYPLLNAQQIGNTPG